MEEAVQPAQIAMGNLSASMKRVYESCDFSDLTIIVDVEEFKLHKVVVYVQSSELKALCDGKEKIKLEPLRELNFPIPSYDGLFRFMYGLEYNDELNVVSDPLGFQIDVYRLASYYNVPRLQSLALEKIQNYYKEDWNIDHFLLVLSKKWYSNDETIRKILVKTCYEHIDELSEDGLCQNILRNDPDLAVALVCRLGQYHRKYYCSLCDEIWAFDSSLFISPSHCPNCGHEEGDWEEYLK